MADRVWEVEITRPEVFGVIVTAPNRLVAERRARTGPYVDSWATGVIGEAKLHARARLSPDQSAAALGEQDAPPTGGE